MRVQRTTKAALFVTTLTAAGLVAAVAPGTGSSSAPDEEVAVSAATPDPAGAAYLHQRAAQLEAERASRTAQREAERQERLERKRQEKKKRAKQRRAAARQAAAAERRRKVEAQRQAAARRAEVAKQRKAAAERRARAARAARATARPAPSGGGQNWAALARCESGGRPGVVSANGMYHGLYQFSVSTWRSVGGSGLPSQASPAEQTKRAKLLYQARGASPWPRCGRHL